MACTGLGCVWIKDSQRDSKGIEDVKILIFSLILQSLSFSLIHGLAENHDSNAT